MISVLPSFEDAFHSFATTLDGRDYSFEFRYNQREACWYFSVSQPSDGEVLISGVKVIVDRPLMRRAADIRLPPGRLVAVSSTSDKSPPSLLELGEGKRVALYYFTADE